MVVFTSVFYIDFYLHIVFWRFIGIFKASKIVV